MLSNVSPASLVLDKMNSHQDGFEEAESLRDDLSTERQPLADVPIYARCSAKVGGRSTKRRHMKPKPVTPLSLTASRRETAPPAWTQTEDPKQWI